MRRKDWDTIVSFGRDLLFLFVIYLYLQVSLPLFNPFLIILCIIPSTMPSSVATGVGLLGPRKEDYEEERVERNDGWRRKPFV
jgi:hypothetical protein